jgi:hypothetical protein
MPANHQGHQDRPGLGTKVQGVQEVLPSAAQCTQPRSCNMRHLLFCTRMPSDRAVRNIRVADLDQALGLGVAVHMLLPAPAVAPCAVLTPVLCCAVLVSAVRAVLSVLCYFVLRSKAAHRVSTLLQEHFGLSDATEDSPRLFASLLPPEEKKVEALR